MANILAGREPRLLRTDAGGSLAWSGAYLQSLALVGLLTACLAGANRILDLPNVSTVYLVPVIIAAIRWGSGPAIMASVGGVSASAYFFYPPYYDLRVSNPQQMMELTLFVGVAIVTAQLADRARAHLVSAQKSEEEVRALYAFSKRLGVASTADEIEAAAQSHLSEVLGYPVLFLRGTSEQIDSTFSPVSVGDVAARGTETAGSNRQSAPQRAQDHKDSGWLVRQVSDTNPGLGVVAVDLGCLSAAELAAIRPSVDSALADACIRLERLDISRALDEARERASKDNLRDAVIGAVSHELRSPLAAVVGSASILLGTEAVRRDARLAELTEIIRSGAERLDSGIQQLLDAGRISGGLRPQLAWTDLADVLNSAVEPFLHDTSARITVLVSDEWPLVRVDPVLLGQALRQLLDNALKYSPAETAVSISGHEANGRFAIRVVDTGTGLTEEEKAKLFERFYRSRRHQGRVAGSGLGLWIARALIEASNGTLVIESPGQDQGTTATIYLPLPADEDRSAESSEK